MILQARVSLTTSLFAWLITPSERLATKALVGISEVVEAWLLENKRLWNPQKIISFSFQFSWFLRFLPIVLFFGVCVCFFDPAIRPTTSWGWHWHWVANKILCQIWGCVSNWHFVFDPTRFVCWNQRISCNLRRFEGLLLLIHLPLVCTFPYSWPIFQKQKEHHLPNPPIRGEQSQIQSAYTWAIV